MKYVNYAAYVGLDVHKDTVAVTIVSPELNDKVKYVSMEISLHPKIQ